jgi:ATP-dependent helicase HrpA
LPRYAKGVEQRVKKLLNAGLAKDQQHMATVVPLVRQYIERRAAHRAAGVVDPALETFGWMLEELRVSLFAQELKTAIPISVQRLQKQWELVRP